MKQFSAAVLAAVMLCAATGRAQSVTPPKPLTNNDVIEMTRAGVADSNIATLIQTTPVKFDVSPDGLIALHAGGVHEGVINQMIRAGTRPKFESSFGVATGTFPVKDAAGKTVRFSAWIKSQDVLNGYAGLWWRVDGQNPAKAVAFDNSQARFINGEPASGNGTIRGATGTKDWAKYEFELPVPSDAKNINFGAILSGTGTAWFDGLRIELNGEPYTNTALFDLDFEQTTAKGFYTGGPGYKVGVDNTTAYQGKQSLKMQYTGDASQTK
jgi:hypothetical protein